MTTPLEEKLKEARVARLGTVTRGNSPHVVPVCSADDGRVFYTALDLKPKQRQPEMLARVRHIKANPNISLLIDEYTENWEALWYVLVRGTATLLYEGEEQRKAHELLRDKYPKYVRPPSRKRLP